MKIRMERDFYRRKEDLRSNKECGFKDLLILKVVLSLFNRPFSSSKIFCLKIKMCLFFIVAKDGVIKGRGSSELLFSLILHSQWVFCERFL